jgi:cytochrome P450 StaP
VSQATTQDPEQFHAAVAASIADPYPVYARYRAAGPLHLVRQPSTGREPEWLVLRHGPASQVLRSRSFGRRASVARSAEPPSLPIIPPEFPTLSGLVEDWLVFMDPPRHTAVRAVIADWLAAAAEAGLTDRIAAAVRTLVDGLASSKRIEFVSACSVVAPMLAVLEMLGTPEADRARLQALVTRLQEGSSLRPGPRTERLAVAEAAAAELIDYFAALAAGRPADGSGDLVVALQRAGWPAGLITATCVHLLASGHETTRNTLSKAALILLADDALRDRIAGEPQLAPAAFDEFMRYDPPSQMITRWAYADERIGGDTIERGQKVTVVVGSANRDPAEFADPDTVRLDRSERRHLGFGLGIHYCVGSALGRALGRAALPPLARLLGGMRLDGPEAVTFAPDMVFHGPSALRIVSRAAGGPPPSTRSTPQKRKSQDASGMVKLVAPRYSDRS